MKRPRQHVIETESGKALDRIIPNEWVIQAPPVDYGIDYIVEIFENEEHTGKTFLIQLKGSDQKIEAETFTKQFDVETLKHYSKRTLPVLLVCYSTKKQEFWAIWANNLIETFDSKVLGQETVKLKLDKSHKIDRAFFENLPFDDLDNIPKKVNIESLILGDNAKLFHKKLLEWLTFFFPNDISFNDSTIPNTIKLEYEENGENLNIHVIHKKITLHKYVIKISQSDLYFNRPSFDKQDFDARLSEAMFVLACKLTAKNISGTLKSIHIIALTNGCRVPENYYFNLVSITLQAISDDRLNDVNSIMQEFTHKGMENEANAINIGLLMASHKKTEVEKIRTKNLRILLENTELSEAKGTTAYNLGNSIEDARESFSYYFLAKKLHPDYLNRFYWWREVAGILFQTNHYKLAEAFYMKALDLMINYDYSNAGYMRVQVNAVKLPYELYPLIADCLFFQRNFKKASEWFDNYLTKNDEYDAEWGAKKRLSDHFAEVFPDITKFDVKKAKDYESKAFEYLKNGNKNEALKFLYNAVSLNPLQSRSWFNIGVLNDSKRNLDETLFAFHCSAIISRNDLEAWCNAFILAGTGKNFEAFADITAYLKKVHPQKAINIFTDFIIKNDSFSNENKQNLMTLTKMALEGS